MPGMVAPLLALAPSFCAPPVVGREWERLATESDQLLVGLATRGPLVVAVGGDREDGPAVILRSTDAGDTWTSVDPGVEARLYDVHFPTETTGYAVGLHGTILRSSDAGASWEPQDSGTDRWLAAVFFVDEETGFAAGSDLLLKTEDGGASWRPLGDGLPTTAGMRSLRDMTFTSPETGFLVGAGGSILRTEDEGATWERVESGVRTWLRAVRFVDEETGHVAGAEGVLLRTLDAGSTWERLPHPAGKLNDVLFVDGATGFTTTMEGLLHATRDGGETWKRAFDASPEALTAIALAPDGTLFVAGDGGTILRRALR